MKYTHNYITEEEAKMLKLVYPNDGPIACVYCCFFDSTQNDLCSRKTWCAVHPATGVCGLCTYMSPMVAGYVCLKPDRRCSNDHQNRMKLPGTLDGKDVVWNWVADNQE